MKPPWERTQQLTHHLETNLTNIDQQTISIHIRAAQLDALQAAINAMNNAKGAGTDMWAADFIRNAEQEIRALMDEPPQPLKHD